MRHDLPNTLNNINELITEKIYAYSLSEFKVTQNIWCLLH